MSSNGTFPAYTEQTNAMEPSLAPLPLAKDSMTANSRYDAETFNSLEFISQLIDQDGLSPRLVSSQSHTQVSIGSLLHPFTPPHIARLRSTNYMSVASKLKRASTSIGKGVEGCHIRLRPQSVALQDSLPVIAQRPASAPVGDAMDSMNLLIPPKRDLPFPKPREAAKKRAFQSVTGLSCTLVADPKVLPAPSTTINRVAKRADLPVVQSAIDTLLLNPDPHLVSASGHIQRRVVEGLSKTNPDATNRCNPQHDLSPMVQRSCLAQTIQDVSLFATKSLTRASTEILGLSSERIGAPKLPTSVPATTRKRQLILADDGDTHLPKTCKVVCARCGICNIRSDRALLCVNCMEANEKHVRAENDNEMQM